MPKYENIPSNEEQAEIEKERTISDAELLKVGASYIFNEKGEKILQATEDQIEKKHRFFEIEEERKETKERIEKISNTILNFFEKNNVQKLDPLFITRIGGEQSWYKFHSLVKGNLNGIDWNLYGGSNEFLKRIEDNRKLALETDTYTDSLCVAFIKEIALLDCKTKLKLDVDWVKKNLL